MYQRKYRQCTSANMGNVPAGMPVNILAGSPVNSPIIMPWPVNIPVSIPAGSPVNVLVGTPG